MKKQAIHNGMFGIITNIDLVKQTAMFSKFGKYTPYLVHLNEIQINKVKNYFQFLNEQNLNIGDSWVDVNDLIKGETYINPNTGDKFIFNRYEITDKNTFAVDTDGVIHIAQKFRKENRQIFKKFFTQKYNWNTKVVLCITNYGMKSCGLNGRTFQPTTKVNQNYKPTDCYIPAIFYTMCYRFVLYLIK